MEKEKKSILKEALTEYNEIISAAEDNAKKKLAEEFPEKFNIILKEEIENKKNKQESYKKIDEVKESNILDETEIKNNDDMKKQKKETNQVNQKEPLKNKTGEVLSENQKFDITELSDDIVGTALESADDDDEIITMDEIEKEISEMDGLEEELMGYEDESPSYMEDNSQKNMGGVAFNKLVELKKQFEKIFETMHVNETEPEILYKEKQEIPTMNNDMPTSEIEEGDNFISDEDIQKALGEIEDEDDVDESAVSTHANLRLAKGGHLPRKEFLPTTHVSRLRAEMREGKNVKFSSLLVENKKLTKKLNEIKLRDKKITELVESYKSALDKYRNQLKEMAIFNTNLAHVNNLLVNEELALTHDEKISVINEFKNIKNITESQNKYKSLLSEMKKTKKTITEAFENMVSASIQPSSKQKLDEVIEKTAYENNEHIDKMKRLINYGENRGKK